MIKISKLQESVTLKITNDSLDKTNGLIPSPKDFMKNKVKTNYKWNAVLTETEVE